MKVELPAGLADTIPTLFGDRGRDWVAALPSVVTALCRRWSLTIVGPAYAGGTHSYVAPVRGPQGAAVLKVPVLDDENYAESAALRCYRGESAVELYDVDLDTGALLLEPAPGESLLAAYERGALPLPEVADIAAGVLRRLRRVPPAAPSTPAPGAASAVRVPLPGPHAGDAISAPPELPFPSVARLARRWATELPAEHDALGRPYDHRLFEEAAELAAALAVPDGTAVLVNRDGHTGNILGGPSAARRWLLIDPKPIVGDAAFDAGHLLWDLLRYDISRDRARLLVDRLAAGLAVDRERVRGWAFIRAVDNISWSAPLGEAGPYAAAAAALRSA